MTTWNDYEYHTLPGGGQGDGDDAAAMAQWQDNAQHCWSLPAWSLSPRELQDHAAILNHGGYARVAAAATKHNNAPLGPNRMRWL
jgi:hypothetical protein